MQLSSLLPSSPLSLLLTVTFLVVSYYVYLVVNVAILQPYRRYRILASQGIKGPPFKPLIGDLLMIRHYSNTYRRLEMGEDKRAMYGLNWQFLLGPFNLLTLSDPDYVLAAWKTQHTANYHKGVFAKSMLGSLFGPNSLVIIDNPAHARHRKMTAPAFHHARLAQMCSIMIQETANKIGEVAAAAAASEAGHTTVELHAFFIGLTFRIIISSAFGNSLEAIPDAGEIIHHALSVTMPIMQKRQLALINYIPILRSLPILGKTESDAGKKAMEEVTMQMVQQRRAGASHSNCDGDDLLDILINARDPETGEGFSDEQIRSDAMTYVLAGHETTSSLMCWVMRDLIQRPALYQQCREEVERVTNGGPLETSHLASLTLIDACVHESFRLRPPVPGISIQASVDHWLQPEGRPGIFIPKDTNVGTDVYGLHTNVDLWGPTAKEWNHERWVKGTASYHKPKHPVAFNGFSVGPRSCIGSQFALMEAKAITALLVRELDMELVQGQQVDVITQKLTIEPAFGIQVRVKRRADRQGKVNADSADDNKELKEG